MPSHGFLFLLMPVTMWCTFLLHSSFFLSEPAVSSINLNHNLGNCLTFTSCIWEPVQASEMKCGFSNDRLPHWPRETGNLPAPASGSGIKAVFEMSQEFRCCLTSCTCDHLATSTAWCQIQECTHCDSLKGSIQIKLTLLLTILNL